MADTPKTLNGITTYIASHLDREHDEPFKRMLVVPITAWYSTLVSRSLEKHPNQRKFFRQTLFMPMEKASPVPCGTKVPVCPIARTKDPLPASPLRFGSELFDFVGDLKGSRGFRQADPGTSFYLQHGKYSQSTIRYEYVNLHIELSRANLPIIRIDGVFDDPIAVMEYNCKNGFDCDWWDKPFPATNDIVQMIIQYILQVDYQQLNVPDTREIEPNVLLPKNKYEA